MVCFSIIFNAFYLNIFIMATHKLADSNKCNLFIVFEPIFIQMHIFWILCQIFALNLTLNFDFDFK